MIAKVIVHGRDRATALRKLSRALEATRAAGSVTNIAFLAALARHPSFVAGDVDTGLIEREQAALTAAPPPDAQTIALAALSISGLLHASEEPVAQAAAGTACDPWTDLTAWRHWGPAQLHATLAHRGERIEATVSARDGRQHEVRSHAGAVLLTVERCAGTRVRYECAGQVRDADVVASAGSIAVYLRGRCVVFEIPDALAAVEEDAASEDRVIAPIPGLVKIVEAVAGRIVAKGDPLVVLEAMKMQHTLAAPRNGTIAEVLVTAGDLVQDGAVLVRLED